MQGKDQIYFELLKQKIVMKMKQSLPAVNPSIELWKGQEISDFQEDLRVKENAHISEKWFYTHMKTSNPVLPRIDMLNFLSKYAGFQNWDDFLLKNKPKEAEKTTFPNSTRILLFAILLSFVIIGAFFGLFKLFNTQNYCFTFMDADTREPITSDKTEVILYREGESPVQTLVGHDGRYRLKTDKSKIVMVVKAPCYKTDSIVRIVRKLDTDETVLLEPDDYALMIQYFSTLNLDDWEKRRKRLNEMIDDEAMICQVLTNKELSGLALFNKQEFIDKLTIPAGSLKNIEILRSQFSKGKIKILRFRTNAKKL